MEKNSLHFGLMFLARLRAGFFYTMFVFTKKQLLTLLFKNNKLSSRRTGRPGGGEQAPRGGVPQAAGRFDLTSTGCRIAASPRERESTRSTGKRARPCSLTMDAKKVASGGARQLPSRRPRPEHTRRKHMDGCRETG